MMRPLPGWFRIALSAALALVTVPIGAQIAFEGVAQASVPNPTFDVTSGGSPLGTLAATDRVAISTVQLSPGGADGQSFETVWEPGTASVDVASIDAPEGFTLEYRTGTDTWSTVMPSPSSNITGLRARGSVTASGYVDNVQTWDTQSSGRLVVGAAAFQGSSGGDGWDVFFNSDATKVFNIWHHQNNINLDCHLAEDGSSCYSGLNGASGTVFQVPNYYAGNKSGGGQWNNKLYVFTGSTSTKASGFYCIDVTGSATPAACATPFIATEASNTLSGFGDLSEAVQVGSKIYGFNLNTDRLVCVDASSGGGSICTGQPYNLGVTSAGYNNTFLTKSGGKVFISTSDGKLSCWNPANDSQCWAPIALSGTTMPLGADGTGGVCFLDTTVRAGGSCVNASGAQYERPSGLTSALATYPITSLHASYGSVATSGTRLYWGGGSGVVDGVSYKMGLCFDFADPTTAGCAGFTPHPTLSISLYATVVDPTDPTCIWGNGDNGKITSFNGLTGVGGCSLPIPEVSFPHDETVPELACQANSSVSAWQEFRLIIPGALSINDLTLKVFNSAGAAISGWDSIDLGTHGTDPRMNYTGNVLSLDLSSLATASTGASPEFRVVTADGTLEADALLLDAEVTFESAPPELCFDLVVNALKCPDGVGISATASLPGRPLNLVTATSVTTAGVPTSAISTVAGTVGAVSGCLGTVVGVAVDEAGQPVVGVPVSFKTGSTTHATVNTNSNGHAVFTNVYPFLISSSELEFTSSSSFRPVSASALAQLAALTAGNTVTGSAMTYTAIPKSTAPIVPVIPSTTDPAPSTTVVPVPTVDESGEEVLPDLDPGEWVVYDDGVAEIVEVLVEETTDLVLRGQDFELRLKGDCTVRLCTVVEENAREVLELDVDGAANVSGYGFKPGTLVHIWLFSDPIYLGSLRVLEDGTFEGSVDLLDVEWGEHTLQVNGISFDDQERTANLGVRISGAAVPEAAPVQVPEAAPVQLPATGTTTTPWAVALGLLMIGCGVVLAGRRRTASA